MIPSEIGRASTTAEPFGTSLGVSVLVGAVAVGGTTGVFSVAFSVVEGAAAGASGLVVVSLVCSSAGLCCSCSLFKTSEVWKAVGGGSEDMVTKVR